ncbi:hypothetical protein GOQ27_09480 [Clostridium sp. D2Q-11]|uniref:DUF4829 domain-containing protein n=1 Tax=Anaeromonas frigoriresistens TaxID=2683708 RepID=A0A942UT17_9FIRM|nr:hypothetical protein [Anaeromonas frigoriresistens]MBS4538694.1 hypothetical protein [Anaeromonas frigoriresistens]
MKYKKTLLTVIFIILLSITIGCNAEDDVDMPDDSQTEEQPDENNDPKDNNSEEKDSKNKDSEENNEITWKTYNNSRFEFNIKHPEKWPYEESQNGDGITFFKKDDSKDIRIYGSNYMKDISTPYKNADEKNLIKEDIILDTGIEATIIKGETDDKYHYEMVYINNNREYHFISLTSIEYYNKNKYTLDKMVNSFNIDMDNNNGADLTKEKAISIENEYMDRLFPQREADSQKVKDFNSKEELINHISQIANRDLVKTYVNNYYKNQEDGLYIIAKGGPTRIYEDKPYELKKVDNEEYHLVQKTEDQLRGKYTFTVKFSYKNNKWIITDRIFEQRE